MDRLKSEVANEAMQRRAYDDNLNLRLAMQEKYVVSSKTVPSNFDFNFDFFLSFNSNE